MQFLKQSTAVALMLGPFLDDTDGKTPETALSLPSGNIRLSKNGGAFATTASAITLTHNESGWYSGTFNTTDTNTLGGLLISVLVSGALPVWREFMVLPAMIYDSFVGGTASLTVTSSGLTPAALTQIVSSGNAALWNDDVVTVSGYTPAALGQIVTSGNAASWNTTNATVTGLAAAALTQIVNSGNAAGWNDDVVTVSGLTPASLAQIVTSGTAAGWNANTVDVTITGLTPASLTQIVNSGNAAGWNTLSTAPVTVSGFTPDSLSQIVSSGNTAGWNDDIVTVSGFTNGSLTQIVNSGNAAGWAANTIDVTVTGFTSASLSQIVSSGNAAGWQNVYTPLTGVAADVWAYGTRTLTNYQQALVAATVVASGQAANWATITGIYGEMLAGTLDMKTALTEMWAYTANNVNLSGTSSGILHTYYDPTSSGLFTLFATPSGRTRTTI